MIKYEIYKESEIEMKDVCEITHVDDLENFAFNRKDQFPEKVFGFNDLEQAKVFFENCKRYCTTKKQGGYTYDLILFDLLTLVETIYEDDDFIQSELLDCYIADF